MKHRYLLFFLVILGMFVVGCEKVIVKGPLTMSTEDGVYFTFRDSKGTSIAAPIGSSDVFDSLRGVSMLVRDELVQTVDIVGGEYRTANGDSITFFDALCSNGVARTRGEHLIACATPHNFYGELDWVVHFPGVGCPNGEGFMVHDLNPAMAPIMLHCNENGNSDASWNGIMLVRLFVEDETPYRDEYGTLVGNTILWEEGLDIEVRQHEVCRVDGGRNECVSEDELMNP